MPWPASLVERPGALAIDSHFSISAGGCIDTRVPAAAERIRDRISRKTGTQMAALASGHPTLVVECVQRTRPTGNRQQDPILPSLGEDESYMLDVDAGGAHLRASTGTGALRGLETFSQLVVPGAHGFQVPFVHIEDKPRFPWRGIMIDVSRHWMPVAVVERNLDAMAAVKMNVFHWHLTDDQGFRVESRKFPQLQEQGSDGHFYTQQQIRQVVAYAAARGIRVLPEFDMPGHATSWVVGMPELASAPGPYRIERTWGIFQPTLDPAREETYRFLDAFIGEMTALFPDPCFHIGGDEVDDTQWKQNVAIQRFASEHNLKDSHALQAYFNERVGVIVAKYGKTVMGWDEVLNPGLPRETIIQSWRGQDSLAEAARKGYRGVLSYGYYLDYLKPASYHYANDPMEGKTRELDDAAAARILGGEACMWDEYVSPETLDSRLWPRSAAIAERLWSPSSVKSTDSMYDRLEAVNRELDWVGLKHRSNYEPMLEAIAGGRPAAAVRVLADAVEATGIEIRRDARKYTSLVPLNRLVDAARVESEPVRHLENCVSELESNPGARSARIAELNIALTSWRDNRAAIGPLANQNSLASELLPISEELSTLGAIGLQALKYIEARNPPSRDWLAAQRRVIEAMDKPTAEVRLAATRPVLMLLQASSQVAN